MGEHWLCKPGVAGSIPVASTMASIENPTTKEDIKAWLEEGKSRGATHVFIVTDTFDYDDYPVYILPEQDVNEVYAEYTQGKHEMQRVTEMYSLTGKHDIEAQLKEYRARHLD